MTYVEAMTVFYIILGIIGIAGIIYVQFFAKNLKDRKK